MGWSVRLFAELMLHARAPESLPRPDRGSTIIIEGRPLVTRDYAVYHFALDIGHASFKPSFSMLHRCNEGCLCVVRLPASDLTELIKYKYLKTIYRLVLRVNARLNPRISFLCLMID